MPQTTYLPAYKADYPILAKAQKPGGVVVSTTLIANAVPNKPTPFTSTIQATQLLNPPAAGSPVMAEAEGNPGNPGPAEDEEEAETA
jgi:hypothetical protein